MTLVVVPTKDPEMEKGAVPAADRMVEGPEVVAVPAEEMRRRHLLEEANDEKKQPGKAW